MLKVTEEIVIDPAASAAAQRVFGEHKRAYIHDTGGKWLVDVLSNTIEDRNGAKWRTVWMRCVEQIQSSPMGDIEVGHVWKVDCNVEYSSYVDWHLELIQPHDQN